MEGGGGILLGILGLFLPILQGGLAKMSAEELGEALGDGLAGSVGWPLRDTTKATRPTTSAPATPPTTQRASPGRGA